MPEITPEFESEAGEIIARYPVSKRSATMPLLRLWQDTFGFIDDAAIHWIAEKLEIQPIHVLELVTFYPMFRQRPIGRNHIRVCRTLSCAMAGSYKLLDSFCSAAGIKRDSDGHGDHIFVSEDGQWSIEFVECLASCGTAPVCMINDDLHEEVEPEKARSLLKEHLQHQHDPA